MGKTKIEWCDYTINPITGCNNGCQYCYARRIYHRFKRSFKPAFHPERLKEFYKIKNPSRIFVGSVTDFWSPGVKPEWRRRVYKAMEDNPKHTYLVLTKRPDLIPIDEKQPEKLWIGVSATNREEMSARGYKLISRTDVLNDNWHHRFISFEPLLDDIGFMNPDLLSEFGLVIIGAMTGPGSKKYRPKKKWIDSIINQCEVFHIPVFVKNNLRWRPKRQEFPE